MRPLLKACFHGRRWHRVLPGLAGLWWLQCVGASDLTGIDLRIPKAGDHTLRILSPTVVELALVNTKQPDPAPVDSWDWVNGQGQFAPPNMSSVKVIVNGQTNNVVAMGFK